MRDWLGWIAAIIGLTLCVPVVRGDDAPSAATIGRWIVAIDSDEYSVREQATKCLSAAGIGAVTPLKSAAAGASPEASWRALQVLGEMCDSADDVQLSASAEAALTDVRDHAPGLAGATARELLRRHAIVQQQQAKAEIERLGGEFRPVRLELDPQEQMQVILDEEWHGSTADLKTLIKLGQFGRLCIWSIHIDDDALQIISQLRGVTEIQLYGTGLDEKVAKKVAAATGATVDWRKGALLGVSGQKGGVGGCRVTTVQPGLAAEKAGIVAGDLIVKFDGAEVTDFESLTREIAKKEPKETVTITVQRSDPVETLTVKATLGHWHRKFAP